MIYVSGVFQPKQIKTCAIVCCVFRRSKSRAIEILCVYEEIISLQFTVHDTSLHICKQCLRKLQKRRGLRTNLRELDEEISQSCSSKAYKAGLPIKKKAVQVHDITAEKSVSPEKRILLEESSSWLDSFFNACEKH